MGIGDELIVTGQCRVMQQTDPRKVRVVYEKPKWFPIWDGNPRIARPDEEGDFQVLEPRTKRLRPYCVAKTPRLWTWCEYRPPRGEIYFTAREQEFGRRHAGRVILEPTLKPGASPNKQWGWVRWNRLAWLLQQNGLRVTQLGSLATPVLEGAELVETRDFRLAAAVLSQARVCVVPEGGLHHAAAAVGARAVVLFGGFISPRVTGYDDQVAIYTGGTALGCGMRSTCRHCEAAMAAISPEMVFSKVTEVLGEASARLVAA